MPRKRALLRTSTTERDERFKVAVTLATKRSPTSTEQVKPVYTPFLLVEAFRQGAKEHAFQEKEELFYLDPILKNVQLLEDT